MWRGCREFLLNILKDLSPRQCNSLLSPMMLALYVRFHRLTTAYFNFQNIFDPFITNIIFYRIVNKHVIIKTYQK